MAIAALTSAACGGPSGAASPAAARPCHVAEAIATVTTATYTMSLATGPPERMYSPSEVAATHPTDGEVMLGGTMTGGDGGHDMAAMGDPGGAGASAGAGGGGALRHVEIHICSRTTGRVIADALPTLVARDPRTAPARLSVTA